MKSDQTVTDPREFFWPTRVYYEDTDAAGVVYHSNYLKFMERARTEWLRQEGHSQKSLVETEGIVFVVAKMNIEFKSPARFDELLTVCSRLTGANGVGMMFDQTITSETGSVRCRADVHIVCVDPETFRPKRIPESIKAKFNL
jgi:acyl-CoA thioester hydrolase